MVDIPSVSDNQHAHQHLEHGIWVNEVQGQQADSRKHHGAKNRPGSTTSDRKQTLTAEERAFRIWQKGQANHTTTFDQSLALAQQFLSTYNDPKNTECV